MYILKIIHLIQWILQKLKISIAGVEAKRGKEFFANLLLYFYKRHFLLVLKESVPYAPKHCEVLWSDPFPISFCSMQ